MIAFEITINNETKIIAGIDDISVLSFVLSFRRASALEDDLVDSIDLSVVGLLHHDEYDDERLDWLKRQVTLGDEITIRVIETSEPTKPIKRRREDPDLVKKAQRKYYENLKEKYEKT
ncbi:hypothetical protein H1P_560014 [Hyella patelloides LEGE 07179]|uniref:Uncharacterized protein n=1 Tax=Hyella patelloides LEGE 07179 TaxID=945734 RepID=A0A563W0K8_9CYAN|nr:hypothetical protein [Hyella patelloides]VEP17157.1 hypothetical protein H1P_560014 [Hyella patelloides LEGE 07179]